jgi:mannose-6-phosphate isomerase-like protein (cupin superfamily)
MIVKGPAGVPGEWAHDSHGGRGEYFVRTLLTSEFKSAVKYMRDLTLKAGSSIGTHPHATDEELYFIVAGRGVMVVDGEECVVGPGDVVLTHPGSSHGLRADDGTDLQIVVVCAEVEG